MTGAEYIVDCLVKRGATDVFGIPGGVVLEFLYAVEAHKKIEAHLSYHEQAAGFAAVGYAQASGKLGVAYATRGPGLTNLSTAIGDAYFESLPTLFLTAHDKPYSKSTERFTQEQEFDTVSYLQPITKYAARIEQLDDLQSILEKALSAATTGNKGSVFVDVLADVFIAEIPKC